MDEDQAEQQITRSNLDKKLFRQPESQFEENAMIMKPAGKSSIWKEKEAQSYSYHDPEDPKHIITITKYVAQDLQLDEPEFHLEDFTTAVYDERDIEIVRDIGILFASVQETMHSIGYTEAGQLKIDLREDLHFLRNIASTFANTSKGRNGTLLKSLREQRVISSERHEITGYDEEKKKGLIDKIFGGKEKDKNGID